MYFSTCHHYIQTNVLNDFFLVLMSEEEKKVFHSRGKKRKKKKVVWRKNIGRNISK